MDGKVIEKSRSRDCFSYTAKKKNGLLDHRLSQELERLDTRMLKLQIERKQIASARTRFDENLNVYRFTSGVLRSERRSERRLSKAQKRNDEIKTANTEIKPKTSTLSVPSVALQIKKENDKSKPKQSTLNARNEIQLHRERQISKVEGGIDKINKENDEWEPEQSTSSIVSSAIHGEKHARKTDAKIDEINKETYEMKPSNSISTAQRFVPHTLRRPSKAAGKMGETTEEFDETDTPKQALLSVPNRNRPRLRSNSAPMFAKRNSMSNGNGQHSRLLRRYSVQNRMMGIEEEDLLEISRKRRISLKNLQQIQEMIQITKESNLLLVRKTS